jgi:hypothetical protein
VTTTRNWGNPSEAIGWYRSPSSGGFVNNPDLGDAEGKGTINSGATTYRGVHFPASGDRSYDNYLGLVNWRVRYWTSTTKYLRVAQAFYFNPGEVGPYSLSRLSAAPIRCVKKY